MALAIRPHCPNCGNTRFARAHRHNFTEQAISILFLPYRCYDCDFRFLGFRRWSRLPIRKKSVPAQGSTLHILGFAASAVVIALSVGSLIHSSDAQRGRSEQPKIAEYAPAVEQPKVAEYAPAAEQSKVAEYAPAAEQPSGVPTPPAIPVAPAPASKPFPAPRKKAAMSAAEHAHLTPKPRSHRSQTQGDILLRSKSSVVIVASNQVAAQQIRRGSRRLDQLIHDGAVFSISSGTAVALEAKTDGVVRVRILQGAMAGKQGWVPDGAISSQTKSAARRTQF